MGAKSDATRILIVEDEPTIRWLLHTKLSSHGFQILEAADGDVALETVRRNSIDLMTLDLDLPTVHGLEVIKRIRNAGELFPIIVLSGRADESGKVRALDSGADDYVSKPFGMDELLARIRAALRHKIRYANEHTALRNGELSVDFFKRSVTRNGKEIKLTPREYDLLQTLVVSAGKVLTHKFLLNKVWGRESHVHYLRIYIRALRQKLEADPQHPQYILTEPGIGYRLRREAKL